MLGICKLCETGKHSSHINWMNIMKIYMNSDLWKSGISVSWSQVINFVIQYSWFSGFCLLPVCICVSRSRNWEFQCKGFECPAVSLCPVRLTAFGNQGVRRSWQWQLAKGKWRRQQHELQERMESSLWEGAAQW